MIKSVKILLVTKVLDDAVYDFIQKSARKLSIEGVAQVEDEGTIKIVACGSKENIDMFVDLLHKGTSKIKFNSIELEPFIKEKDYRGVFRIIQ